MQKFFIVTPCFNSERYIEETLLSVLRQSAVADKSVDFEYWIVDGGSTDRTQEIVGQYTHLPNVHFISEPDKGMYDALVKGFNKRQTDAICAYINAGDLFSLKAFEIIAEVFGGLPEVKWVTGINTIYNEKSQVVSMHMPYTYRSLLVQQGFYGPVLPSIQQESTFWHSSLMQGLDYNRLRQMKLAGDAYLWHHFSKVSNLYVIKTQLGGFKVHSGQLSENISKYYAEMKTFSKTKSIFGWLVAIGDWIIWRAPLRIKTLLSRRFIGFNHLSQKWLLGK